MSTRRTALAFLAAALFAVLALAPARALGASDVLDLKKADFADKVKKEDLILVEVRPAAHRRRASRRVAFNALDRRSGRTIRTARNAADALLHP